MNDPEFPLEGEVMLEAVESVDVELLASKLGDAIRTAASQRPEVRAAVLDIDDAKLRARVADNLILPNLDFLGTVQFQGLDDSTGSTYESLGKDNFANYLLGLSFEIPFGNRAARADREKALLDKDRSIIACRRVLQDVVLDVKTALRSVHAAYELIVATRANRLAATENLRALMAEEASNRKLTPEFLNLKFTRQERLARAQLEEVGAVADYHKALADYHRAVGTGLEVKRIEFRDARKRKKGAKGP
jgi:outer membrane protein TolC